MQVSNMSPDVAAATEQASALRVAIIGGGIGGLAAAVCLQRAGAAQLARMPLWDSTNH